jgi:hypothetical protein
MKEPLRLPAEPLIDGLAGFGPRTVLRFNDTGFTLANSLFGTWRFSWNDIDGEFEPKGSTVAFNLTADALRRTNTWTRWNCRLSRALTGSDRQVKAIIFGRSPISLAHLLNDQRVRRVRLHQHTA